MFKIIEGAADCEIRSVIRFLNARNVHPKVVPKDCHGHPKVVPKVCHGHPKVDPKFCHGHQEHSQH